MSSRSKIVIAAETTGTAVVGEQYLKLLKKYNPKLAWDSETAEHTFTYKDNGRSHLVHYPTLKVLGDEVIGVRGLMLMFCSLWMIESD